MAPSKKKLIYVGGIPRRPMRNVVRGRELPDLPEPPMKSLMPEAKPIESYLAKEYVNYDKRGRKLDRDEIGEIMDKRKFGRRR